MSLKRVAASYTGSLQRKLSVLKESIFFSQLSTYSYIVMGSFICMLESAKNGNNG